MALPFLPSGVDELPAKRFVLFADQVNRIQKVDESLKTADGSDFDGRWVSPSLSRGDPSFLWTLSSVQLFYVAEADTTVQVEASPNGGASWPVFRPNVSLEGGTEEVHSKVISLRTTGDDLRIRITFTDNTLVIVLGYRPKVIRRGDVRYG